MVKEQIKDKADNLIEEMCAKMNELLDGLRAEGMSEDDIADVLSDVVCRGIEDERFRTFINDVKDFYE